MRCCRQKISLVPKHHVHAFVVPTLRKVREEWGTHCVISVSETEGRPILSLE